MSLHIQNLSAWYNKHQVLYDINLKVKPKEIHCLIGESGSGKSTILKILFGISRPIEKLVFQGNFFLENLSISHKNLGKTPSIQLIFQEPSLSFNPHWTLGEILLEPLHLLKLNKENYFKKLNEWLEKFGFSESSLYKSIQNFSGGEKQRIAIIRAVLANPKVLCMDEPVSGLDRIMLYKTIEYIKTLRNNENLSIFIVSHDLDFVKLVADTVSVLEKGRLVESKTCKEFFKSPSSSYTKELLESRNLVGIKRPL